MVEWSEAWVETSDDPTPPSYAALTDASLVQTDAEAASTEGKGLIDVAIPVVVTFGGILPWLVYSLRVVLS